MKKILIVEDEEALGKILEEELNDHGFQAKLVIEGGQAVFDMVKSFHPDLVLLDLLLPKMHGLEILKALKSDVEAKMLPVIILSNLDQDEDIKNSLKLGASDYFIKSQHPIKEVIEKIKHYIIAH